MADGHRLRHDTYKSVTITVPLYGRPWKDGIPKPCGACGTKHAEKTIHLTLDADGCTIVSDGVLASLRAEGPISELGFTYSNVVSDPPAQQLGAGRLHKDGHVLRHQTLRDTFVVVADPNRTLLVPQLCDKCRTTHRVETWHLFVNADGRLGMAPHLWQRLRMPLTAAGFILEEPDLIRLERRKALTNGSIRRIRPVRRG